MLVPTSFIYWTVLSIYIGIFFNLQFNFSYDHNKVHLHCHYRTTDRILITFNNYRLLLDTRWTCGRRYASNLVVIKLKQYQRCYRWILSKSRFKWSFADRENQYVAQRSSGNPSSNTYSNFWGYQCTYKSMWLLCVASY